MTRGAAEIDAANRFHSWRLGWRDGAMRRAMNRAAEGHSDGALAAAYCDGYTEGYAAARAANAAACERYGYSPTILRAESATAADAAPDAARERGR
jgi:hypothetical protein